MTTPITSTRPHASKYVEHILRARVYDVAIESPLDYAPSLSACIGNRAFFEREDLQPIFSFKLRGAYKRDLAAAGRCARGAA